jgi:hypothetical protein
MRPCPPRGSRPTGYRPCLEALEDRCLPASVSVLPGGTLLVLGTRRPDHVQIVDNGTNAVNNVTLVVNRRVFDPGVAITNVNVFTRGGGDSVVYTLTGPLLRGVARSVSVNLGSGNGSFRARVRGTLQTASTLTVSARGTGSDILSLNDPADINAGATLVAAFKGGDVANAISTTYQGQLRGTLVVFAEGGAGPDTIDGVFTLTNGSSGTLSAQELGGFGDDSLFMNVLQINAFDRPALAAAIDGGPGVNHCTASSNVTTTHCQFHTML